MTGERTRRPAAALLDRWSEHPAVDNLAAGLVLGAHLLVVVTTRHGDLLGWSNVQERREIYTAASGVAAIIFGFSTVAANRYADASGQRMKVLRKRAGTALRRNWMAALATPLGLALLSVVLLALDTRPHGRVAVRWIFEAAFLLTLFRGLRLLWLFREMVGIQDAETSEPARAAAPAVRFQPERQRAPTG